MNPPAKVRFSTDKVPRIWQAQCDSCGWAGGQMVNPGSAQREATEHVCQRPS